MHVRDVGADGEVDCDRDAMFVGGDENAEIRKLCVEDIAGEELAGRFPVTCADALGQFSDFVEVFAGFLRHAKLAGAEAGINVFGSVADQSDFKIVDEGGAMDGDEKMAKVFRYKDVGE